MADNSYDQTKPGNAVRRGARPFAGPAGIGLGGPRAPILKPLAPPFRPPKAPLVPARVSRAVRPPAETAGTADQGVAPVPQPTAPAAMSHASETSPVGVVADTAHSAVVSPASFGACAEELDQAAPPAAAAEVAPSPDDDLSVGLPGALSDPGAQVDADWAEEILPAAALEPSAADTAGPAWLDDSTFAVGDVDGSDLELPDVNASAVDPAPARRPAWLESLDEAPDAGTAATTSLEPLPEHPPADADWAGPLVAEYAPYVATPDDVGADIAAVWSIGTPPTGQPLQPDVAAAEAAALEEDSLATTLQAPLGVLETPEGVAPVTEVAAPALQALDAGVLEPTCVPAGGETEVSPRDVVGATLERLAGMVRAGQIDVRSVAPRASEASVLASVLAALLARETGGSANG